MRLIFTDIMTRMIFFQVFIFYEIISFSFEDIDIFLYFFHSLVTDSIFSSLLEYDSNICSTQLI